MRKKTVPPTVGTVFGRLTVLGVGTSYVRSDGSTTDRSRCRCCCGAETEVKNYNLRSGRTVSCGCIRGERNAARATHAMTKSAEYSVWLSMKNRCENQECDHYERYGGRGIIVCERWQSFESFYSDMGPRPSPEYSIERDELNGNYEPRNCRWATDFEQRRNRSDNVWFEFDGRRMILSDWAAETGVSKSLIRYRRSAGWTDRDAVFTPPRTAASV